LNWWIKSPKEEIFAGAIATKGGDWVRIVVCIKQVSYVYHPLAMDVTGSKLDPEKTVSMLNPYDEIAMEEAVTIKECVGDCEIVAASVGLAESDKALRYAFAMGADRMIRIDFESIDPWLTSRLLARAIKELDCDLVLCGKKAIDTNAGQVGAFLGELLKLPQVSGIVCLKVFPEEKRAIADRYLGKGDRQAVECSLPALFTVEDGLNDPRYATLANRLLAEKEAVEVIKADPSELCTDRDMDFVDVMSLSSPRPKPKKVFRPNSNMSASERLKIIMSGGITEKKGQLLGGKAKDVADKIASVLSAEGII
jgi:electron transfer flavoprotein beta subunit